MKTFASINSTSLSVNTHKGCACACAFIGYRITTHVLLLLVHYLTSPHFGILVFLWHVGMWKRVHRQHSFCPVGQGLTSCCQFRRIQFRHILCAPLFRGKPWMRLFTRGIPKSDASVKLIRPVRYCFSAPVQRSQGGRRVRHKGRTAARATRGRRRDRPTVGSIGG